MRHTIVRRDTVTSNREWQCEAITDIQGARFTGIAPGEQSRGGAKTIKFGINTKNTGINSYKTSAVNAAPRGAPWGSVGAPWGPVGPPWGPMGPTVYV